MNSLAVEDHDADDCNDNQQHDTVRRFEVGSNATMGTVTVIQHALEAAGVEFVNQDKRVGVMIEVEEPSL